MIKNILSIAISFFITVNSFNVIYANEVDDFERLCKYKTEEFRYKVKSVTDFVKENSKNIILRDIKETSAIYLGDLNKIDEKTQNALDSIGKNIESFNQLTDTFNSFAYDQYSIEKYKNLYIYNEKINIIKDQITEAIYFFKSVFNQIKNMNAFIDNLCSSENNQRRVEQIHIIPFDYKNMYDYHTTNNLFDDPIFTNTFMLSMSAILIASFIVYASIEGISSALALIGIVETESGVAAAPTVALTIETFGAFLAIVLVSFTISYLVSKHQQKKEEKKIQRIKDNFYSEIDSIKNWYDSNKLNDDDFSKMSMDICEQEKINGNSPLNTVVTKSRLYVKKYSDLIDLYETHLKKLNNINIGVKEQLNNLSDYFIHKESKAVATKIMNEINSEKSIFIAEEYFKVNIRKNEGQFTKDYLENRNDCYALKDVFNNHFKMLDLHKSNIERFKTIENEKDESWGFMFKKIDSLKKDYQKYIDNCLKNKVDENEWIPVPYL